MRRCFCMMRCGITTNSQAAQPILRVSAKNAALPLISKQKNTCSRWYAYKICIYLCGCFLLELCCACNFSQKPHTSCAGAILPFWRALRDSALPKTTTPSIHEVIKSSNHIHPFTPHVCFTYKIQCDVASLRLRSYKTHQRRHYVRDMVIISYYFCWKI